MVDSSALNSYHKAQVYEEMDPKKLIHMLYEGAIKRIKLTMEGLKNNDPKQRGENLGKAIAIIAELNASLDENVQTEEINFLRSLYSTMLVELPKVSVTGDMKTLERTEKYLAELKKIWEETVMDQGADRGKNVNAGKNGQQHPFMKKETSGNRTSIAV